MKRAVLFAVLALVACKKKQAEAPPAGSNSGSNAIVDAGSAAGSNAVADAPNAMGSGSGSAEAKEAECDEPKKLELDTPVTAAFVADGVCYTYTPEAGKRMNVIVTVTEGQGTFTSVDPEKPKDHLSTAALDTKNASKRVVGLAGASPFKHEGDFWLIVSGDGKYELELKKP